ncbi:MAG: response regulator transcription factor [Chroococcidiopsidaceae cyanobacterium CP_BM_ER_R8_30]|nr:response regulator transcription factor [Chroococcidiopsidaceae cyanobacterium CP_BM_ER_R8_30]
MIYGTSSRILLVEDEELIKDRLGEALAEAGYLVVKTTMTLTTAIWIQALEESAAGFNFDVMILHLRQPQVSGLELVRWVRQTGNPVPILIVSACASPTDIVLGLEMGADDYLAKPFGMRELNARIQALQRRIRLSFLTPTQVWQFRDIKVYHQERRVLVRDQEVHLSPKEFDLLVLLISSPNQVWSRQELFKNLWSAEQLGNTKTLEVHIHRLREKLELDPKKPEYIITVEGLGYRFG